MSKPRQQINPVTGQVEYYCFDCLGWKPVAAFGTNPSTHEPRKIRCRVCVERRRNQKKVRR